MSCPGGSAIVTVSCQVLELLAVRHSISAQCTLVPKSVRVSILQSAAGLVDLVLSRDGDALVYGAEQVIKEIQLKPMQ